MRENEGDAGQEIGQARVSVLIVVSTCRLDAARGHSVAQKIPQRPRSRVSGLILAAGIDLNT